MQLLVANYCQTECCLELFLQSRETQVTFTMPSLLSTDPAAGGKSPLTQHCLVFSPCTAFKAGSLQLVTYSLWLRGRIVTGFVTLSRSWYWSHSPPGQGIKPAAVERAVSTLISAHQI